MAVVPNPYPIYATSPQRPPCPMRSGPAIVWPSGWPTQGPSFYSNTAALTPLPHHFSIVTFRPHSLSFIPTTNTMGRSDRYTYPPHLFSDFSYSKNVAKYELSSPDSEEQEEPTMPLSEVAGQPVDTSTLSHLNVWQKTVAANPNALAVISHHQKAANFRWVSSQLSDVDFVQWTFAEIGRAHV